MSLRRFIQYIERIFLDYRACFSDRRFLFSAIEGFILFAVSLVISTYAINYAGESASNSVTDLILSNTRVYDVDGVFVYGAVAMVVFAILVILTKPRSIPFVLKTVALFYVIRSGFVVLTHISPYPEHVILSSSYFTTSAFFKSFFTGDDLFFSGHTGLPLLLAFIFWDSRPLRIIFILASVVFAIVVLLGHVHYSIDVAAAFFIVPTIYRIAEKVFRKDWKRLAAEAR